MAKPNPTSLIRAIKGMKTSHSIYVGDSMEDLIMAKKATEQGYTTIFCGIIETSKNPQEKLERKQKIKIMREIVDQLKPRYRELVVLRYFRELSYEEIATETELPLGTVKAQLFRVRNQLYKLMQSKKGKI